MKRATLIFLVALATLTGCRREVEEAPEQEGTSGQEVEATAASEHPVEGMAMAAIAVEDVELEIYAIDVGQGDATLIVGPEENGERFTMLIDAGRGSANRAIRPLLERIEVAELDIVVATHYDEDHIGGFTTTTGRSILWTRRCEALAFFPKVAVVDPGPTPGSNPTERQWDRCVGELTGGTTGVDHFRVTGGNNIGRTFDLGGDYKAKIVAGGGHVLGTSGQVPSAGSKNEMSVAILVSNPDGFDFLVTGDLIGQEAGAEDARLEGLLGEELAADDVDVEVLQVGHHGAANASEPSFIRAIQPEVAIISVGDNNGHGHPTPRAIKTLDDYRVPWILQTNVGKPHCTVLLHDCGDDPNCTQTRQIVVNGVIHIVVADDKYDIETLADSSYFRQEDGRDTLPLLLECDLDGCVEEVQ